MTKRDKIYADYDERSKTKSKGFRIYTDDIDWFLKESKSRGIRIADLFRLMKEEFLK